MSTMRERAEAGAALLDEHFGTRTWDKDIDLERLGLGSTCGCVLGQLFDPQLDPQPGDEWERNGYAVGQRQLGLTSIWGGRPTADFGFTLDNQGRGNTARWGALTRTWKRLIRERIAARRRS